jgi:hypothetical protein
MKRIAVMVCAVLGLAVSTGNCQAGWGHLFYSGYQPWWNVFAKRYKCLTPEEERLQKFWHDYYNALQDFYRHLDAVDWVAYYKNHGYQINGGGAGCGPMGCNPCCGRINYAPVFVTPTLQWAVPAGCAGGPPVGPPYAGAACGMPMGGGMPMAGMPMNGGHINGGAGNGAVLGGGVPNGAPNGPATLPPVTAGTTTTPPVAPPTVTGAGTGN